MDIYVTYFGGNVHGWVVMLEILTLLDNDVYSAGLELRDYVHQAPPQEGTSCNRILGYFKMQYISLGFTQVLTGISL